MSLTPHIEVNTRSIPLERDSEGAPQPGAFELRESAGLRQVFRLAELAPMDLLARHYGVRH